MILYKIVNGNPVRWKGERLNGIMYQKNIDSLWSEAELKNIGLYYMIPDTDVIPSNKIIGSKSIVYSSIDDLVYEVNVLVDKPPQYLTLSDAENRLNYTINRFIRQYIPETPDSEKFLWNERIDAIKAYQEGTIDSDQTTLLQSEAQERGISVLNHAQSIRNQRRYQIEVMSKASGVRQKALDMFVGVVDPHEYETIISRAETRLQTIATNRGWTTI